MKLMELEYGLIAGYFQGCNKSSVSITTGNFFSVEVSTVAEYVEIISGRNSPRQFKLT